MATSTEISLGTSTFIYTTSTEISLGTSTFIYTTTAFIFHRTCYTERKKESNDFHLVILRSKVFEDKLTKY